MTIPVVTPAGPADPTTTTPGQAPVGESVRVQEPAAEPAKPGPATGEPQFTAEQIEAARRQEKDKLNRLEQGDTERKALLEELSTLRAEREERAAAEAKREAEAEDAAKAKREADMSAKSLLEQRTQEWEERFATMERERATERETLAKEAEYNRLRAYAQERVSAERDSIAPELHDLINGNTQEEIDASVELMKSKTQAILDSVQQAQTAARSQMRGVSATGFTSQGPLDSDGGYRNLSAEDIKNMPMAEYQKYRSQLLGAASEQHRQRGIFG
ncbi:hypothetical protein [Streptomyces sp. CBMA29]|uniref:hypothetical protein n=1 Tax=Streptomyces sp. CBMA29 TaxID=1896314 RepID=UPI00166202F6|nr:hypothetical protein [Streptomyces sp. CBMA29]MBD0734053.1 hypothetical protein [Streptomyces sp. CBMA29]